MERLIVALFLGAAVWLVPSAGIWRVAAQDSEVQVVVERPLPGTSTAMALEPTAAAFGVLGSFSSWCAAKTRTERPVSAKQTKGRRKTDMNFISGLVQEE